MDYKTNEMTIQCHLLNVELPNTFSSDFDMFKKALLFASEEKYGDIMVNLWQSVSDTGDFVKEKRTIGSDNFIRFPVRLKTGNVALIFIFPDSIDYKRFHLETKAWAIVLPNKDIKVDDLKQSDVKLFTLEYKEEDDDSLMFALCGWKGDTKRRGRVHLNYGLSIRPANTERETITRFISVVQTIIENNTKPALATLL